MENSNKSNFWDTFGKIVAMFLTLIYVLFVTNAYFSYIPAENVISKIISYSMLYGPMILIIISCMDALGKRSMLIRIIFLALWVLIFIFSFFPSYMPF